MEAAGRKRSEIPAPKVVETPPIVSVCSPKPVPQKEGSSFLVTFLSTVVFIVTLVTFWVVVNNGFGKSNVSPPPVVQYMPGPVQDNSKIDQRLEAIDQRLSSLNYRIWLLAIANNENASINQQMDRKFHSSPNSGYIQFSSGPDEGWKINRIPNSMDLTPEQKQDLQKSLK